MEIMKLKPTEIDYIWGGTSLSKAHVKKIDFTPLSETWE